MPKYTLLIPADHTGTGHRIEFEAATPWLAIEKSQARFKWLSAELFDGPRSLGRVEHLPLERSGVWHLVPTEPAAA